jgi:hypothetical protein
LTFDLKYSDVTLNGLGRVVETLQDHGVRLDVTCKTQINNLADLSLLNKVRFIIPVIKINELSVH